MQKKCLLVLVFMVIGTRLVAQVIEDTLRLPPDSLEKIKSIPQDSSEEINTVSPDSHAAKNSALYARVGLSMLLPFTIQQNPVVFPAITVALGVRLIQTNSFIMSLNIPVSFMVTTKYDFLVGGDFPFMLDFNLGSAAAGKNRSSPGFIFGVGYAYIDAVNNYNAEEGIYKRSDFWGYRIEFGIDIGKEKDSNDNDRSILMFNYGHSFIDRRLWMVGISYQIMLGKL